MHFKKNVNCTPPLHHLTFKMLMAGKYWWTDSAYNTALCLTHSRLSTELVGTFSTYHSHVKTLVLHRWRESVATRWLCTNGRFTSFFILTEAWFLRLISIPSPVSFPSGFVINIFESSRRRKAEGSSPTITKHNRNPLSRRPAVCLLQSGLVNIGQIWVPAGCAGFGPLSYYTTL